MLASHIDSKLHAGFAVWWPHASQKQKCATMSPIESELVVLMDKVGVAELFADFFGFIVGKGAASQKIYQDSISVISLYTKRSGCSTYMLG